MKSQPQPKGTATMPDGTHINNVPTSALKLKTSPGTALKRDFRTDFFSQESLFKLRLPEAVSLPDFCYRPDTLPFKMANSFYRRQSRPVYKWYMSSSCDELTFLGSNLELIESMKTK